MKQKNYEVYVYKEIIAKYHQEVWNEKNIQVIHHLFSNDVHTHSPLGSFNSRADMEKIVNKWILAIPDMRVKTLHIIEEGDLCTLHWETHGTHQKELNGIPAKNNPLNYRGCTLFRFKGDKVVEYWAYIDIHTLERQMRA